MKLIMVLDLKTLVVNFDETKFVLFRYFNNLSEKEQLQSVTGKI